MFDYILLLRVKPSGSHSRGYAGSALTHYCHFTPSLYLFSISTSLEMTQVCILASVCVCKRDKPDIHNLRAMSVE